MYDEKQIIKRLIIFLILVKASKTGYNIWNHIQNEVQFCFIPTVLYKKNKPDIYMQF